MNQHPYLWSRATDSGLHRRVTPEMNAFGMAWLGEPPTDRQAEAYAVRRRGILRARLEEVTAQHSLAEGPQRAALALQMADLHAAIEGAL